MQEKETIEEVVPSTLNVHKKETIEEVVPSTLQAAGNATQQGSEGLFAIFLQDMLF